MSTDRDTHFVGFAEKLYEELARNVIESPHGISNIEAFKQEQYQIIARRAYDLVAYTMRIMPHLIQAKPNIETVKEALHYIPDLTVLLREAKEQG